MKLSGEFRKPVLTFCLY